MNLSFEHWIIAGLVMYLLFGYLQKRKERKLREAAAKKEANQALMVMGLLIAADLLPRFIQYRKRKKLEKETSTGDEN